MVQREVQITNITGLHLRPAGDLCTETNKFKCKILIEYGSSQLNAKSVLSVLAGKIRSGAQINLICDGEDEQEALEYLCDYIEHYVMTR